ncbi:flagellar motor switch protein FliG [Ampullimonas aquatilis]|uniref:flagellar motor switch protein FliG n=1 Tax=Ampullimonas aquatilis TaxID=1341549 RepID=UPI003C71AD48
MSNENDGLVDGAILLMSLGEEQAAEVLKYLAPREVQKLGTQMAKLKSISREKMDKVLGRFHSEADENTSFGIDSDAYLRDVLTKALGDDKANLLLNRILDNSDTSGIESLKFMEASSVAELIRNEHPQIIASIIVHLERDQAAQVLALFTDRLKADVMLRIVTLDGIQPLAMRELNDVLSKLLTSGEVNSKKTALGGVDIAAEILNFAGSAQEQIIIDSIKEYDEELAQKISDKMFTFDNILDIDDRGIQTLLREIQSESLIIALKGANEAMREKIFKNMSSRAAEMLREDLESRGPVRVSEVEAEQKEILKVVRRLSEEGQIMLGGSGGGDDAFV